MEKSKSFPEYSSSYSGEFDFENRPNSYNFNGSKSNGFAASNDPELKRKKRIASYNVFATEGKLKSSVRNSFKWIKNKISDVRYAMDIGIDELLDLQFLNATFDDDVVEDIIDESNNQENHEETVVLAVSSIANSKHFINLKTEQRKQLLLNLFSRSTPELKLHRGIIKETAIKFDVSRWLVQRLWKEAVRQQKAGEDIVVA